MICGANGLSCIFNDGQIVLASELTYSVDFGALSEQMNGNNRLGFLGDRFRNLVNIDVECVWSDINEDRCCSKASDTTDGREERKAWDDDFIARGRC